MWSTVEHANSETACAARSFCDDCRVTGQRKIVVTVSDRDRSLVFKCAA